MIGAFSPTISCQMSQTHWWARMTSLEISLFTVGTTSVTLPLSFLPFSPFSWLHPSTASRGSSLLDYRERERESSHLNCVEKYHEVRRNSIWWWTKSASFETPSSCFFTTYFTYRNFSLFQVCSPRIFFTFFYHIPNVCSLNSHKQQYFMFGAGSKMK